MVKFCWAGQSRSSTFIALRVKEDLNLLLPRRGKHKFLQEWAVRAGQDLHAFRKTCLSLIFAKESCCFAGYFNNVEQTIFALQCLVPIPRNKTRTQIKICKIKPCIRLLYTLKVFILHRKWSIPAAGVMWQQPAGGINGLHNSWSYGEA